MDRELVWQNYKDDWDSGRSPAIEPRKFNSLFWGEIAHEALELIKTSPSAHKSLDDATKYYPAEISANLNHHARWPVWFALRGIDGIDRLVTSERKKIEDISSRSSIVAFVAENATSRFGRGWIRARLCRWWREAQFVEEEKEALLQTLGTMNVLSWTMISELGLDAIETVNRLVHRGDLGPTRIDGLDVVTPPIIEGSQPGNSLCERIGGLLQTVTIPLEIRDSCLRAGELTGTSGIGWINSRPDKFLIRNAIRRLKRLHPIDLEELSYALSSFGDQILQHTPSYNGAPAISFPLIRLLHMRLLLESPSLSLGLNSPEEFLVPEVLTYTLGHDSVSYVPELRMLRDMDRRWRARWAESAGEAMSIMFLESTVGIELSTLVRIAETSEQETPDFKARTNLNEPIVWESKGATTWKTHRDQRLKALKQLGKRKKGSKSRKPSRIAWSGDGRGFAISLFAAIQGSAKSSLLHVDDPPFRFGELFSEGWEEDARRTHYCAVLETAQLFEAAEDLRLQRITERQSKNIHFFTIDESSNNFNNNPRFVGTFLPIFDIARRLRHPNLKCVEAIRVFVGVQEEIYNDLLQSRVPDGRKQKTLFGELDSAPLSIPPWGLLPGLKPGLPPRGIYSSLSNGAFLAVELQ